MVYRYLLSLSLFPSLLHTGRSEGKAGEKEERKKRFKQKSAG
jgi:hypothetical protein